MKMEKQPQKTPEQDRKFNWLKGCGGELLPQFKQEEN